MKLRYIGFEQSGSIRAYRFQQYPPKGIREDLVVFADLALFTEHHLAIQDGPTVSLEVLIAESEDSLLAHFERVLTEVDIAAHIAARPVHVKKPGNQYLQSTRAGA